MNKRLLLTIAFLLGLYPLGASAEPSKTDTPEDVSAFEKMFGNGPQEEDYYRADRLLVSATRHLMTARQAPAIATVILARDIQQMGARSLVDVFQRVPGLGISRGVFSLPEIEVRGLKTTRSEKIKLMIDGHTMNYPVWGGAAWAYDTISLDQVERIEIIRGPGSALYGANAFSGIINVVTRTGNDLDGQSFGAELGPNASQRYHMAYGHKFSKVDILTFVTYTDRASDNLYIERDLVGQSGHTDDWARSLDGALRISDENYIFNARLLKRENGPYIGVTSVLNDQSKLETSQFFADLSFNKEINSQWQVEGKVYGDYLDMDLNWELFPEGVPNFLATIGMFPPGWGANDNMLGTPSMKNSRYGIELGTLYKIAKNDQMTIGGVYEKVRHYDLEHHANFNPLTGEKLPSYQDVTAWANWGVPAEREIFALYAQNEWSVLANLHLTLGMRYDSYSDFGDVANPRVGLVWNISRKSELKLLYGQAFRAPNFEELYLTNNPATKGNPDLEPEYIETYEINLAFRPLQTLSFSITSFHNNFIDRIELIPIGGGLSEFQNGGDATIYGFETEAEYIWTGARLYGNYTWQHPENDQTGEELADVPAYRYNLGLDFDFTNHIFGNLNLLTVGDMPRSSGDLRDNIDSYTTADLSVSVKDIPLNNLDTRLTVKNLFDQEYAYPSPINTVANDFPAPGRSFSIELSYLF